MTLLLIYDSNFFRDGAQRLNLPGHNFGEIYRKNRKTIVFAIVYNY